MKKEFLVSPNCSAEIEVMPLVIQAIPAFTCPKCEATFTVKTSDLKVKEVP